jgi:hypothetical protein
MKAIRILALAAGLAAASACGGSSNATTTTPTVTVGPTAELFEGTLAPGGAAFFSFTVQQTGDTDVMLASVATSTAPGATTPVVIGIGVGSPLGTDCSTTTTMQATAALTSPLVVNMPPGIYCVRAFDIGNLRQTVNFAVRIVHT